MIKVTGLTEIQAKFIAITESLKRDSKLQIKQMEIARNNWVKQVLPEIVKTSGANIGVPFREKKGGKPYAKYRKYSVPFGYVNGVWSGETYYALWKKKDTDNTEIINNVTVDSFEYGFYNENIKYINFNIGVTEKFLESETKRIVKVYEDKLRKAIQ